MLKKLKKMGRKKKRGSEEKQRASSFNSARLQVGGTNTGSGKSKSRRSISSAPKINGKKPQQMTLSGLPRDVLLIILHKVNPKVYLACMLTCKTMQKKTSRDYKKYLKDQRIKAAEQKAAEARSSTSTSSRSTIKRADAYDWGKVLGKGAFGDVVSAVEKETQKKVAIKVLNKQHVVREKKQKYVKTERDILAGTNHFNIVKLHNTFQDKENLYFIMELAERGELLSHLNQHGKFSPRVAAFYLAELILALEHLHSLGIIHRDVKPENILIATDFHVKLTDFGTAKNLGTTDKSARTYSFTGTPEYIAPELLEGDDAYSCFASDFWACGCVLYQMLTGRPPFKGDTQYLTLQAVKEQNLEFPEEFDEDAKDLVLNLLKSPPEERLGAVDLNELKKHKFFTSVDWDNIHETTPPEMP